MIKNSAVFGPVGYRHHGQLAGHHRQLTVQKEVTFWAETASGGEGSASSPEKWLDNLPSRQRSAIRSQWSQKFLDNPVHYFVACLHLDPFQPSQYQTQAFIPIRTF